MPRYKLGQYNLRMFDWLVGNRQQVPIEINAYKVSANSSLYVECEPPDPHTASNIVITAFISKTRRVIVPTKVQWTKTLSSVYSLQNQVDYPFQKISHRYATYMCEPSDLGCILNAKLTSLDEGVNGSAQVTIGPIRIDVMMKRLIEGALYSGTLLSQVTIVEGQQYKTGTIRLLNKLMQFKAEQSQRIVEMNYSISQPRIEINPKDPTKLYLRFEQDSENKIQTFIQQLFNIQHLALSNSHSSKTRIFKSQCPNKIQVKFVTRHTRDLFLFSHKSFIACQLMKSQVIMQKIEKLEMLSTETDYKKFLQFITLKEELYRIVEIVKQLQQDRDKKIKDLTQLEESIGELSLTYLKIIQEKAKHSIVDFNQSYSIISNKRQQIMHRKDYRKLKQENQNLKDVIKDLTQQLNLIKFFKKEENNESIMINQTTNPFTKKPPQSNFYKADNDQQLNIVQLSRSYARVLHENQQLKKQYQNSKDKSRGMGEILIQLEKQQITKNGNQNTIIKSLRKQNQQLKLKLNQYQNRQNSQYKVRINSVIYRNLEDNSPQPSILNVTQSFVSNNNNQSITTQTELKILEQKLLEITELNRKMSAENTRLRNQRNYYRQTLKQLINKNTLEYDPKKQQLLTQIMQENKNLKQEIKILSEYNQSLTNQIKSLKNRIQSLSKQKTIVINQIQSQQEIQSNKQKKQNKKQKNYQENIQLSMESQKLKKINYQLFQQIKNLKIQNQKLKNEGYNSRVIELESQVQYLRQNEVKQNQVDIITQLSDYRKKNHKLHQENNEKNAKLQSQQALIQKFMEAQRSNRHMIQIEEKYKKKIKDLQDENLILKRSTNALNRSRDISMDMEGFYEEQLQLHKKQMNMLIQQNQRLGKLCDRYAKDARQAMKSRQSKIIISNEL